MGRKKSSVKIGQSYETMNGERLYTPVYDSMLLSEAFKDLSAKQRMLYIVCKEQCIGHSKPSQTIDGEELFRGQEYFFLSCEDIKKYSLYSKSNKRDFYTDMGVLIDHGFIALVSSGKRLKHKNIYKLDKAWQEWKKPSPG